jgi:hypothetical protein
MYQENLGIDFGPSRPLRPSPRYSTGKNRSNRCFFGCNLGTILGGKQKIGAKICCILLSFFLGYGISCFSEQNRVPLWTSESFREVASQNKIEFCSGLWGALEELLLGTKSRSARLCRALERLLLRTKLCSALAFRGESSGGKFTTASSLC